MDLWLLIVILVAAVAVAVSFVVHRRRRLSGRLIAAPPSRSDRHGGPA